MVITRLPRTASWFPRAVLVLAFLFLWSIPRQAGDQRAILNQVFAGAEFRQKTIFVTRNIRERVRELVGRAPKASMLYITEAWIDGRVAGRAFEIHHRIRTKSQRVLVCLDAGNQVRYLEILDFREPPEYKSPRRWLELFYGHSRPADIRPGDNIPVISGATLTSRKFALELQKYLAILNAAS